MRWLKVSLLVIIAYSIVSIVTFVAPPFFGLIIYSMHIKCDFSQRMSINERKRERANRKKKKEPAVK